jgi:hypothetical protein
MSDTRTRSDLITEVLDQLGVTSIGQTLSAEDVEKIDSRLDNALAEISELEIYTVDDPGSTGPTGGEIPASAINALGAVIAQRCAASFGMGSDPSIFVLSQRAEKTLRSLARPARARRTLRTDSALRGRMWPRGGSFTNGT